VTFAVHVKPLDLYGQYSYKGTVKRRKPKAQRKEATIQIRLTAEQKRVLTDAAERAGLDVSSWLRNLGLTSASK
jgi:hypothetical protein